MYKVSKLCFFIIYFYVFSSCKPQVCVKKYSYNSTSVTWTAYKFTSKVGLRGTFSEVNVLGAKSNEEDWKKVLLNAVFTIPTKSVNTNLDYRDDNIRNYFFNKMVSTENIEGKITSIDENEAIVEIRMNGNIFPMKMLVNRNENVVSFNSVIDLNDWKAKPSMDSLQAFCYDLHKGTDGISKFWPDVKLEISTLLKVTEDCK
jgi:hypothetical protein